MNTASLIFLLISLFNTLAAPLAQQPGNYTVTIRLRAANGDPMVGETVALWRPFPIDEPIPPTCRTNESGTCTWTVGRGLYAVVFENLELDEISALSVGEAGLFGLGLTVGDHDITYHFTVANENKIYFDAAPDSPIPQPIIPTMEDVSEHWYGGSAGPNATTTAREDQPTPTPTAEAAATTHSTDDGDSLSGVGGTLEKTWTVEKYWPRVRLMLLIIAAIGFGYAGHRWQRRRKANQQRLARQQKAVSGAAVTQSGEGN